MAITLIFVGLFTYLISAAFLSINAMNAAKEAVREENPKKSLKIMFRRHVWAIVGMYSGVVIFVIGVILWINPLIQYFINK